MREKPSKEIALERIRACVRNNAMILDLGGLSLSNLPAEIGECTGIVRLDAPNNQLSSLPKEIAQLSDLRYINFNLNHFTTIPLEITQLTRLESVAFYYNRITSLPREIGNLINLRQFYLGSNELSFLPPEIGNLINLEGLDLNDNQLSSIPDEIGKLAKLRQLDLEDNRLAALPPSIKTLTSLGVLHIENNPISLAPEIISNSETVNQTVNYLELVAVDANAKVTRPLNESKVVVVGQGGVGKTSLVRKLVYGEFDSQESKTEGIYINQWWVDDWNDIENQGSRINLNMWDFGGQEIMHATHQFFLSKRSLYLLVLDARLTPEENRLEYWLKIIQSFGDEPPVILVGNKTDQHPLDIDRIGLKKKYPNIVNVFETSAATGMGIEALRSEITEQINEMPHVRDLLPENWFTVKAKIEELRHESNFITQDKYLELCIENKVDDEVSQRTLLGFLHDLGVILYFQNDPRLEAFGILNPQWVTNGVYKILNSHRLFKNRGLLTLSMLDEILNLPEYPRSKRLFIVDMMKKFELCYDLQPDKAFLVPDLLPKDQPDMKFSGIPAFEYAYSVLPSGIITRFIMRMNQHVYGGLVWRTGVLLKIGENQALVKADIEDRKITIAIDGLEHTRRDALSAIRYQLDEIHSSIKGLDAQKRVPVPGAPNAEPLEYDYLLMLEREGDETCRVKDGNRLVTVNVRQVLSAIEHEAERKEHSGKVTNIYVGGNVDGNMIIGDENVSNKS